MPHGMSMFEKRTGGESLFLGFNSNDDLEGYARGLLNTSLARGSRNLAPPLDIPDPDANHYHCE